MVNPDIAPDPELVECLAKYSAELNSHKYSIAKGVRKLREAFCEFYSNTFNVKMDPEESVCVTHGSKDAFLHTLMAITKPGDKVLVGTPTYPAFLSAFKHLELEVSYFEIADEEHMLSEISDRIKDVKILVLNFPNNPTGKTVSKNFYDRLEKIRGDAIIINDFVYGELGYNEQPVSLLSTGLENKVEIYSLSKAYCIPGWRVGALVGDPKIVNSLATIKSQIDYGIFTPIQMASVFALNNNQRLTKKARDIFKSRYNFVYEQLEHLGCKTFNANAGCSIWTSYESDSFDGLKFANNLLVDNQIAILPGVVFGEKYLKFFRISLVQPDIKLGLVTDRIGAILRE